MFYRTEGILNNQDEFNEQHVRNIKNTGKDYYNCAGYALETFSWYCPNFIHERHAHDKHQISVQRMLTEFPNMRIIININELKEGEYAIAFKTSDNDFHFIKRAKNGHWYQKRGEYDEIEPVKQVVVFGKIWGEHYNSETTFFAKKRI